MNKKYLTSGHSLNITCDSVLYFIEYIYNISYYLRPNFFKKKKGSWLMQDPGGIDKEDAPVYPKWTKMLKIGKMRIYAR